MWWMRLRENGRAQFSALCTVDKWGPICFVSRTVSPFFASPLFVSTPQSQTADKSQLSGGECCCCPHRVTEKEKISPLKTATWDKISRMDCEDGQTQTGGEILLTSLLSSYLTQFGFVKWRQFVSRHHDDPTFVAVLPQRFSTNKSSGALNHILLIK